MDSNNMPETQADTTASTTRKLSTDSSLGHGADEQPRKRKKVSPLDKQSKDVIRGCAVFFCAEAPQMEDSRCLSRAARFKRASMQSSTSFTRDPAERSLLYPAEPHDQAGAAV